MSVESRINLDDYMTITQALADPHRVRVLLALRNGEVTRKEAVHG